MAIAIERMEDPFARWAELEPLLLALHEYHLRLTGVPLLADWPRIQREHIAGQHEGIVLFAHEDGVAVGFANGWISRRPSLFEEEYARLDNMYVAPAARSREVGQQLLAQFETWALERGVGEVRLGVVASNELGRRFWDAAGFTPASIAMKKLL